MDAKQSLQGLFISAAGKFGLALLAAFVARILPDILAPTPKPAPTPDAAPVPVINF